MIETKSHDVEHLDVAVDEALLMNVVDVLHDLLHQGPDRVQIWPLRLVVN